MTVRMPVIVTAAAEQEHACDIHDQSEDSVA
jgi:hypothetical protein